MNETPAEARRREVWERRQRGDKFVDIARDMEITPTRVHQLYYTYVRQLWRTGKPTCPRCGAWFTLAEAQHLLRMAELDAERRAQGQ